MGKVLSIGFGEHFLERLAESLLAKDEALGAAAQVPLHQVVIALPTRRACLSFAQLLLQKKESLLLPHLIPLGDLNALDEVALEGLPNHLTEREDTIHPIERHLIISALIKNSGFVGQSFPSRYLGLGSSLSQFIDLTDRFEVDRLLLKTLVPDNLAAHWQKILSYLDLLIDAWPSYLQQCQQTDIMAARTKTLHGFADNLPSLNRPFLVAGSTGSQPATAALLKATAIYKEGTVVLPFLDLDSSEKAWAGLSPSHPQFGLKRLLQTLELSRKDVEAWGASKPRATFIHALFSPDGNASADVKEIAEGIKNIELIETDKARHEASVIAWAMLEKIKTDAQASKGATQPTIALITPDRNLARRVSLVLKRFAVEIDDEAGVPLTTTPSFIFLKLISEAVVADFQPLALFSCLKHPLAMGGLKAGALRRQVRAMEYQLRTAREQLKNHESGFAFYTNNLDSKWHGFVRTLEEIFAPLVKESQKAEPSLNGFLTAHVQVAEALAASAEENGELLLWAHNETSEALADYLKALLERGALLDNINPVPMVDYPAVFEQLFANAPAVRPFRSVGSPLHIWHPSEARLQKTDFVILGGLNEGVWPAHLTPDPWLSRAMRKTLGLESEEAQMGRSAHDFAEGLAHGKVLLTRARKDGDGNPLKPSPWLLRLKNFLEKHQQELTPTKNYNEIIARFHQTELADETVDAFAAPQLPQPLLTAKPTALSASAFTELLNDPYSFYAGRILKLKELNNLSADPQAAERGSLIHDILEKFIATHSEALPPQAEEALLTFAQSEFEKNAHPFVRLFWWSHFEMMAKAFITLEQKTLRAGNPKIFTEIEGRWQTKIGDTPITLKAIADRIDMHGATARIYDYKTGAVPRRSHVPLKAPQLPFEALILKQGGFAELSANRFALAYIDLKKKNAGEMLVHLDEPELTQLEQMVRNKLGNYFSDAMVWEANEKSNYKTYRHLARLKEKK